LVVEPQVVGKRQIVGRPPSILVRDKALSALTSGVNELLQQVFFEVSERHRVVTYTDGLVLLDLTVSDGSEPVTRVATGLLSSLRPYLFLVRGQPQPYYLFPALSLVGVVLLTIVFPAESPDYVVLLGTTFD
jgi:hypothetical protein